MDRDELLRVLRALRDASVEYVIIGATAMAFHEQYDIRDDGTT